MVTEWPGAPGAQGRWPEVQGRALLTCRCGRLRVLLLWACPHSHDKTKSHGMTEQFSLFQMGGRPEKQPRGAQGQGGLDKLRLSAGCQQNSALSGTAPAIGTSHTGLFALKFNFINSRMQFLVPLATFRVLSSHILLVAIVLDSPDQEHFHHHQQFCWMSQTLELSILIHAPYTGRPLPGAIASECRWVCGGPASPHP